LEDEEWSGVQNLQGKKGPSKITKDICKFFSQWVYCPYPDHRARLALWQGLIERYGGAVIHHFNVSTLATLSVDYSIGAIDDICKLVLTPQCGCKVKFLIGLSRCESSAQSFKNLFV
jgi:hypothetical protein